MSQKITELQEVKEPRLLWKRLIWTDCHTFKNEREIIGLEASEDLDVNHLCQQTTETKPARPKPKCHQYKKPRLYRYQSPRSKRKQKQQTEVHHVNAGSINIGTNEVNSKIKKNEQKPKTVYWPCEACGKTN